MAKTCGCAAATYGRQPVRAGGEGTVTVTYHPKGHPGSFDRRIFVYTQLSDVEEETNGLLTYDRRVNKLLAAT